MIDDKIHIKRCPTASSSYSDHVPTREELERGTDMHIADVQKGILYLVKMLLQAGKNHDHTKKDMMSVFWNDFSTDMGKYGYFKGEGMFCKTHYTSERHHLTEHVPEDVNLVDVIEYLCDCVMAGAARSEKRRADYRPLPPELLEKAFHNTFEMLADAVEVEE